MGRKGFVTSTTACGGRFACDMDSEGKVGDSQQPPVAEWGIEDLDEADLTLSPYKSSRGNELEAGARLQGRHQQTAN